MNTTTFLKRHLDASDEEILRLIEMATNALVESTDYPAGGNPEERVWRYLQYPYYLGLFARRVVAAEGISNHVKEKLCHACLQVNLHLEEGQEPGPGLFMLTAWLGTHSLLTRRDYLGLRRGIIWLPRLTSNYEEHEEYLIPACRGIFTNFKISREESIEIILMVLTAKEAIGARGRPIFDFLMSLDALNKTLKREVCNIVVENAIPFPRGEYEHPLECNSQEQDRLSIRFLPGSVRRRAVVWLARLGGDPMDLLKKLLKPGTVRGYGGDHVASGALDLLDEQWENIEEQTRLALLAKAADLPDTSVRKRAYILGEKYMGMEFLEQSLDDKAKSLREWARERLERREVEGPPSIEQLQAELEEEIEE
ncbi:hypothetical protein [Bradymonas sediminis]|nr:hypothetical protein [Bradymonas sediminis]TDP62366.1 hypothetical protein DFR33_11329 [Bradymonas sediminis]